MVRAGRRVRFTDAAWGLMEAYRWPGNVRELQNVVEQLVWMSGVDELDVQHLPPALRATVQTLPVRERRRQLADDLYDGLVSGTMSFWDQLYGMFLNRDITRHDLRELVRRGLITTRGSYGALVTLFGMSANDYKRLLNFLAAHECSVDARPYRRGLPSVAQGFGHRPVPVVATLRDRACNDTGGLKGA
jgi:DNA-binding NtrC family response regulator